MRFIYVFQTNFLYKSYTYMKRIVKLVANNLATFFLNVAYIRQQVLFLISLRLF